MNNRNNALTKKKFERLLKKAAQPKKQSDSKGTQTSAAHPSDGYSGKRKSRGKTEGKEG
jgi:hypothetical protein